jgi:hypothetical protein
MKSCAPVLACLAVASTACGFGIQTGDPEPPLQTVTNEIETFAESGELPSVIDFDLYKARINDAFGTADAINFTWRVTRDNLSIANWPDLDDPETYEGNLPFYRDYARLYRNSTDATSPFGVFFVTGPAFFEQLDCGKSYALGISTSGATNVNNVPADPKDRFTFIFVQRVEILHSFACYLDPDGFSYPRDVVFTHLITHELGHQRAGLTHSNVYPSFHKGSVPGRRVDVMSSILRRSEFEYTVPVFDRFPDFSPFCNTETCVNNLHCRRNVT